MGITFTNAAFLVQTRLAGVSFDRMLTLGHQQQYLTESHLQKLAKLRGLTSIPPAITQQYYAQEFFKEYLDSENVQSIDYSDYEGCDIVHDMNEPIDENLHVPYDVVMDGGSLEHIFNFPVALSNCMRLVKEGGSLIIFTANNNLSGHGFYQFSPELFFRTLHPSNGFRVRQVVLEAHQYPSVQLSSRTKCYSVVDPAEVRQRVCLVNNKPTTIMIHAVKERSVAPFGTFPIQSDYAQQYSAHVESQTEQIVPTSQNNLESRESWTKRIVMRLPAGLKNRIIGQRERRKHSFANRDFYRKWDPLNPSFNPKTTAE